MEQALALDEVDASTAPRIAPQQPPPGENQAAEYAEPPDRLNRVLRAGRVIPTALAEHWGDQQLVGTNREHRETSDPAP